MAPRTDATSRREQILKAAARLFAERGFHGVGVDEIGAAVGISGPGLYRHFAGKDAMLAELLVGISEQLLTGGQRRVAASHDGRGGPLKVLDSLIEGHIAFALDDRPLITLHDRELDRLRDSDRRLVRQLQRRYVELWVDVVRQAYPRLAEPTARASVHAVFGLLNSTPHLGLPEGARPAPARQRGRPAEGPDGGPTAALPGRAATAVLLHRLARGAFDGAQGSVGAPGGVRGSAGAAGLAGAPGASGTPGASGD